MINNDNSSFYDMMYSKYKNYNDSVKNINPVPSSSNNKRHSVENQPYHDSNKSKQPKQLNIKNINNYHSNSIKVNQRKSKDLQNHVSLHNKLSLLSPSKSKDKETKEIKDLQGRKSIFLNPNQINHFDKLIVTPQKQLSAVVEDNKSVLKSKKAKSQLILKDEEIIKSNHDNNDKIIVENENNKDAKDQVNSERREEGRNNKNTKKKKNFSFFCCF